MSTWTRWFRASALLLACVPAVVPGIGTTWAEVGVTLQDGPGGAQVSTVYASGVITDDPGPFGIHWMRYRPDTHHRAVLNEEGFLNGDGPPSMLRHPLDGRTLVAWSRNTPQGYDVVLSEWLGDAWSPPALLAGTPADELDPYLAADPVGGSIHLVYWVHDAAPRVMHRELAPGQATWSPAQPVSQPGEIACRPGAVVSPNGLRVVYEAHDNGYGSLPRRIVLARWDGVAFVPETLAIALHPGRQWPQVHAAGDRLWVDWVDDDDAMVWTRQPLDATSWEPLESATFSSVEQRDYGVRGGIKRQALD